MRQAKNRGREAPKLAWVETANLRPDPSNPRTHSRQQIRAIARSIEKSGFNAPILVTNDLQIIAGHGRYEAAKFLGFERVPVLRLDHLNKEQARAYMLADNKLTDRSSWDDEKLALHLKELCEIPEFDIEATGFESPEIDFRVQSLETPQDAEKDDEFDIATGPAVSRPGDLWLLGEHRIFCGKRDSNTGD